MAEMMTETALGRAPLSQRTERLVVGALHAMRIKYRRGEPVTFGDLFAPLGPRAAALGSALLAAPFLAPVSLGPLTGPVSLLVVVLGVGLIAGAWRGVHPSEADPESHGGRIAKLRARLLATPFPRRVHDVLSGFARRTVKFKRRVCRERLTVLVDGFSGQAVCGTGLVVGAVLLAVPLPFIPLGNVCPALTIILCAVGWTERDGLLVLCGWVAAVFSVLYFAVIALIGADFVRWAGALLSGM